MKCFPLHSWLICGVMAVSGSLAYTGPVYVKAPEQVFLVEGIPITPHHLQFISETLVELAEIPDSSAVKPEAAVRRRCVALAIALTPLHPPVRKAWRTMHAGRTPQAPEGFPDMANLGATLWQEAQNLSESGTPDALIVAVHLMEIALAGLQGDQEANRATLNRLSQQWPSQWPLLLDAADLSPTPSTSLNDTDAAAP